MQTSIYRGERGRARCAGSRVQRGEAARTLLMEGGLVCLHLALDAHHGTRFLLQRSYPSWFELLVRNKSPPFLSLWRVNLICIVPARLHFLTLQCPKYCQLAWLLPWPHSANDRSSICVRLRR